MCLFPSCSQMFSKQSDFCYIPCFLFFACLLRMCVMLVLPIGLSFVVWQQILFEFVMEWLLNYVCSRAILWACFIIVLSNALFTLFIQKSLNCSVFWWFVALLMALCGAIKSEWKQSRIPSRWWFLSLALHGLKKAGCVWLLWDQTLPVLPRVRKIWYEDWDKSN